LQVGEQTLLAPKDTVQDINIDVMDIASKMKPHHTQISTMDGNHFQGHSVPVNSVDEVVPAIGLICIYLAIIQQCIHYSKDVCL